MRIICCVSTVQFVREFLRLKSSKGLAVKLGSSNISFSDSRKSATIPLHTICRPAPQTLEDAYVDDDGWLHRPVSSAS